MDDREIERAAKYFSVLQSKLCIKILLLLEKQDYYVYELAEKFNLAVSVVSVALQKLRLLDVVGYNQMQRYRKYFLKRHDVLEIILQLSKITKRKNPE